MFTGIIEEVGFLKSLRRSGGGAVIEIDAKYVLSDVKIGDSIAVNGLCLTVTDFGTDYFTADIMPESLNRSSLGSLIFGDRVNLERAMAAGGRFGGHIVSGHIDGTGRISKIRRDSNAVWYTINADKKILKYVIEKGSIAIDGVSLTVAAVSGTDFSVSVIPHTAENTALPYKKTGDIVNLENDLIGKYIEKLLNEKSGITREFLARHGI